MPNGCNSTLAGVGFAMYDRFGGMVGFVPGLHVNGLETIVGGAAEVLDVYTANPKEIADGTSCTHSWRDPRDDVMAAANELMFRTGLSAAQKNSAAYLESRMDDGLFVVQNVTGSIVSPTNVYKSDFGYFAAAAMVELFTILIIFVNFRGYWRLGRHTTFSPLEIAKVSTSKLYIGGKAPDSVQGI